MSDEPTHALSADAQQLLVDIARKQLAKRLAEAQELAQLLADLGEAPIMCICPCGAAGHRL